MAEETISEFENEILNTIRKLEVPATSKIAREMHITVQTAAYRLEKLERMEILSKQAYVGRLNIWGIAYMVEAEGVEEAKNKALALHGSIHCRAPVCCKLKPGIYRVVIV